MCWQFNWAPDEYPNGSLCSTMKAPFLALRERRSSVNTAGNPWQTIVNFSSHLQCHGYRPREAPRDHTTPTARPNLFWSRGWAAWVTKTRRNKCYTTTFRHYWHLQRELHMQKDEGLKAAESKESKSLEINRLPSPPGKTWVSRGTPAQKGQHRTTASAKARPELPAWVNTEHTVTTS